MTYPQSAIEACEGLTHMNHHHNPGHQLTDEELRADAEEMRARIDKWFATKYAAPVACGLSPSTDDAITEWLHREEGGAKVDTAHPGPIVMLERPSLAKRLLRRHGATLAGALFALALISASMFLTPDVTEQLMRLAR